MFCFQDNTRLLPCSVSNANLPLWIETIKTWTESSLSHASSLGTKHCYVSAQKILLHHKDKPEGHDSQTRKPKCWKKSTQKVKIVSVNHAVQRTTSHMHKLTNTPKTFFVRFSSRSHILICAPNQSSSVLRSFRATAFSPVRTSEWLSSPPHNRPPPAEQQGLRVWMPLEPQSFQPHRPFRSEHRQIWMTQRQSNQEPIWKGCPKNANVEWMDECHRHSLNPALSMLCKPQWHSATEACRGGWSDTPNAFSPLRNQHPSCERKSWFYKRTTQHNKTPTSHCWPSVSPLMLL